MLCCVESLILLARFALREGDLLYSRGPQAEQRVYVRQACSTVRVVILTEAYKMSTEHNIIPGAPSYKTLANHEAGRLNGGTSG